MNCRGCHHTHEAHKNNSDSNSLMKSGRCTVPLCKCKEYLDPMEVIDEELL